MLVTLARGLTAHGKSVAFITYGNETAPVTHGGIDIYSVFGEQDGIRGVRNIHPRLTAFYRVMKRVNAPVYVQMGAGIETAMTCLTARFLLRRKMAYCVASDSDCMASTPLVYSKIESAIYKIALRFANLRVSQTISQQAALEDTFSLESTIIPMPHIQATHVFEDDIDGKASLGTAASNVLWVGRPVPGKRLEMLVDVAELHPDINFHMVGADNNDTEYSRTVAARAKNTKNIEVHGKASESKLQWLYKHCDLLACTSEIEGFPATFMEAWSYGKPVITTFDPDGIVSSHDLGLVCRNAAEFSTHLINLTSHPSQYNALSESCKIYYTHHFTAEAVIPRFVSAFESN